MTEETTEYNFLSVCDQDLIDLISNILCTAKEEDFIHIVDQVTMRLGLSSGTCLKIVSNLLEWTTCIQNKEFDEKWYYTDFTKDMLNLKETVNKKLVIIQQKRKKK